MPLFACDKDRKFLEGVNSEMYGLYMHKIDVWKLHFRTGSEIYLYHEDQNSDIIDDTTPTYSVPGHVNVTDNGLAALYKQGQQLDRELYVYMSRKGLEDALKLLGLDFYRDVPTDGDIMRIQDGFWEVITVDPEGYHMNDSRIPFDFQFLIKPWQRSGIPKTDTEEEFKRF